MLISNLVRSSFISRLKPWLVEEPELELELGLLASHGCAKKLTFDPLALNPLLKDFTRLEFKRVEVGELRLHVRPWSSPSIVVEVRGFHAILTDRVSNKSQYANIDSAARKKKEMIAALDPEGASMHNAIERLLAQDISCDSLITSLADATVSCSQIEFHDILFELQLTENPHACLLEIDNVSFNSQTLHDACLFRKILASLFAHGEGSQLSVSCNTIKIGVKENDQIMWISSLMGLSAHVKLNGFHPLSYYINVSTIMIEFSPEAISMLLLILNAFSYEENGTFKTGKALWKIAANRIGYLTLGASPLRNSVEVVVLWSHYVYTYSFLLTMVGTLHDVKENVGKHSIDRKLITQAKHQMRLISKFEEKLPAQMVVQARRIARNKRFNASTDFKETVKFSTSLRRQFHAIFWLLWKLICFIIQPVLNFSLSKVINLNCDIHNPFTLGGDYSSCFKLEEVFITYSHSYGILFSITKEVKREDKLSFPSFYLSLRQLLLLFNNDATKIYFLMALSKIKLCLTTSLQISLDNDLRIKRNHSSKVYSEGIDESKSILWGDSASLYHTQQFCDDDSLKPFGICLQNDIKDLWSTWDKINGKHEAMHMGEAFMLGEFKYFLADPYIKNMPCGLHKYTLNIGNINIDLDYSCILSAKLLFRELEGHFRWGTEVKNLPAMTNVTGIVEDRLVPTLENSVEFYVNNLVGAILNMIPDKNILLEAVIAGLCVQLSPEYGFISLVKNDVKPAVCQGNSMHWLKFDIGYTEVVIWPASKAVLFAMTAYSCLDEVPFEYLWLKEPQIFDAHINEDANGQFNSHGRYTCNVFLRSSVVNVSSGFELIHNFHIAEPISITIKTSICRDHHHTFYATTDIVSVAFSVMLPSASLLLCMDEFENLFQLFEGMLLEVPLLYNNIASDGPQSPQEFVRKSRDSYYSVAVNDGLKLPSKMHQITAIFELRSLNITLGESRKIIISKNSKHGLFNHKMPYLSSLLHAKNASSLHADSLPGSGLGFSIQNSCINLALESDSCVAIIDLSGLQTVLLDLNSLMIISNDMLQMKKILLESLKPFYRLLLAHCRLRLHASFRCGILGCSDSGNATHNLDLATCQTSFEFDESRRRDGMEKVLVNSDISNESGILQAADIQESASCCSFAVVTELGAIVVSEYTNAILVKGEDKTSKLEILIFSDEGRYKISCKIKGGLIFLEVLALTMFLHCFQVYWLLIPNFPSKVAHLSKESSTANVSGNNIVLPNPPPFINEQALASVLSSSSLETQKAHIWIFIDALTIHLSRILLTLVFEEKFGKANELIIEIDVLLRLADFGRKIIVGLNHLAMFTQNRNKILLNEYGEKQKLHFCSQSWVGSASRTPSEENSHKSSDFISCESYMPQETFDDEVYPTHRHILLKRLFGSATIGQVKLEGDRASEEFSSNWAGEGSVSGLNLMIKLSEMQMFSYLYALLSEILPENTNDSMKENISSGDFESSVISDLEIPNGAIVAIQDLQQHMYFTVEHVDSKYHMVGTLHYSLAGERALFKVRYHSRWWSRRPCISFLSLYAKNYKDEQLCLNFNSGSGFVGISGFDGNSSSLWQTFQCEVDQFEEDGKALSTVQKSFHLVNLKSDYAVAFVDGMPEFVKKPGNRLKVKLFDGYDPCKGIDGRFPQPFEHQISYGSSGERSGFHCDFPHINIRIDDVSLTIFHEVSDMDDQLPLFRFCFYNIAFLGQILPTKLRILSSFNADLHHFDSRINIWREFIAPAEFCLYYRSRFTRMESITKHYGIPIHFFFRMSQVYLSLTEASLDLLLYLIGELGLAGPYAVRRSVIFPNSCKLENCTNLTVDCQFPKNHTVVLSRGQSSVVQLRFTPLAEQQPCIESSLSITLCDNAGFLTLPVAISLSNACFFAWKTRILSSKDSRMYPGPFVVVEVSPSIEEGMSITISPLLRVHNESRFPVKLWFRRPEEAKSESAFILLEDGDSVDDSRAAFDALDLDGGSKRTLLSLSLGNFLLSLRPHLNQYSENNENNISLRWSEEIKGGKAMRISGIFEKLNNRVRTALGVKSSKSTFSILSCPITMDGQHISDLHFLIRTIGRDVPLMQPQNLGERTEVRSSSPFAMQMQKEIFIYPTVEVYNLLHSEIFVHLSEDNRDMHIVEDSANIGKQATIPCQSSAYFYANLANICFRVTLNAYGSTSKAVNSGTWAKKFEKRQTDVQFIDMDLDFAGGSYFAILRLSCSDRGLLEATIFTRYTIQNNSELALFCSASRQKNYPKAQTETEWNSSSDNSPQSGWILPPKSIKSWLSKSNKVFINWLECNASTKLLDLDVLTSLTELSLEATDNDRINRVAKLGVSIKPFSHRVCVPAQVVSFVPRLIIANEFMESIVVRQSYLQDKDDLNGDTIVESGHRVPLHLMNKASKIREHSLFNSVFRRHTNKSNIAQIYVQFGIKEVGCPSHSWSGPICISSLGRFFLKFKRHSASFSGSTKPINMQGNKSTQFAMVHIVEEKSSLILYFLMPPNIQLPYRIENLLQGVSIKYYQKDLTEVDILRFGASTEYAWDDLNLPHKLIVEILDFQLIREINIDKICEWKPFFKLRQHRGILLHFPFNEHLKNDQETFMDQQGAEIFKLGFEVYADGSTRVLRFCESTKRMDQIAAQPSMNFQLVLSAFVVHFLENNKQMEDAYSNESLNRQTIIIARLGNITFDSLITHYCKYIYLKVQSLTVDEKWLGAPFASMVRRSRLHDLGTNMNILQLVFILQPTNSKVKQVKYSSIIIQPIDLKIDEETLMMLVPFWRSSVSNSREQSQQFYFKHFEIHPLKITASFLPANQYLGYSSSQETLRSFLHSILKLPSYKNVVLELNGVLLTHALVTTRELLIKCAQHYSWYLLRAIYITKGSSLLPPAFASLFDDTAASSLDVFFDPSDGSISLPGLTIGMFKVISKCINAKGFSGTRRYFGDLGKTMKTAGSNVLFATLTEISDNVLRGAETNGFKGLVTGFHQGILRLAMEPSLLGAAVMEGGPDRRIKLDCSPGIDELYIEGYLQAMLDVMYKLDYLRVRVVDNQVLLKNLPPNSSVINEILENVKSFLVSKALLKGSTSASSSPLRHLRSENDWKLGPTVLTLCEHLFVSFTIRMLRNHASKFISGIKWKGNEESISEGETSLNDGKDQKPNRTWAISKFFLSGMIAYIDGRLCRHIPNTLARRIVSGFLLSFLDKNDGQ